MWRIVQERIGQLSCLILLSTLLSDVARAEVGRDTVFVVQHGWHPGILIPLPQARPLMIGPLDTMEADYLDVGWGDAGYYPDPDPGLWTLLRAALWPTRGVIQLVPVTRRVEDFSPAGPIIAIPLPDSLIEAVVDYVLDELEFGEDPPPPVAPSIYGNGYFFDATRRYHMFQNSNQWAARALSDVGCELSVWQSLTIELLLPQLVECGVVVRNADDFE